MAYKAFRVFVLYLDQGQPQYHKIIERYQSAIALYQKQSRQDLASQLEQSFLDIGIHINQI